MAACATCSHPQRREIDRQLRAGVPDIILSEYTRSTQGGYLSRLALGRHRRAHLGVDAPSGRRPMSDDFARDVQQAAAERLAAGELQPSLRDGLAATALIDRRDERQSDRDLMVRISMILTGNVPQPVRVLDAMDLEREAIEAEYRGLLTEGR